MCKQRIGIAVLLTIIFLSAADGILSQETETADEPVQRGSIPEELLRPRRGEAPRYPIDTVIGELGQGRATEAAYLFARRVAAALLDGNTGAPSLSAVNKIFVEGWIGAINNVNPRVFRMGSGRQEPDGSFSFLIRFIGRDEGITGELFVRLAERRIPAQPPAETKKDEETDDDSEQEEDETVQAPPPPAVERIWVFEDLILEEPRSREDEIKETKHRYDFSPYERFF